MIGKRVVQTQLLIVTAIIVVALLAGCAVKKEIWGDPKSGLNLTYRMEENQILKYQVSAEEIQQLDMMGQTMETTSKSGIQFSLQSKGLKEGNLLLGITVDTMNINVSGGMAGNITPDLGTVIGKSFQMTLSPLGAEGGFSGTEELQYQLGPSGKRNIDSSFKDIFPDLADKSVKIGDTWTKTGDVTEKAGNIDVHVITESVNTLQGLETVNGLECVKIEAKTTGTIDGSGEQMGNKFTFKGTVKGSSTWYFAYKKGIFVSRKSNSDTEGTVEVTAMGMTIPMKSKSKSEFNLIE
jgi:hypothetical protein